ncbi:SRR1-like protein isoform X2 [Triplophysa dalaica]|uniref:SRR1-like protein isoform X2 n=1 Tax=Triplophysa dalaica TaxID=1582913 RepID=UPI0024E0068A|nr:SRR1-like protein isoform X2 [Triplophysa dalaica]
MKTVFEVFAGMACNDDWQVAGRRKGASRRIKHLKTDSRQVSECQVDKQRTINAMNELRGEDFWLQWRDVLSEHLLSSASVSSKKNEDVYLKHCVCYGLGNFASCISARYQLAMLLLLLETLQIPAGSCCVYDPAFSVSECNALRELGFNVLTENEEGKRAVSQPTLFYLMHCGKALYNNLLWKNWSPQTLPNIVIIGNSFHGIQERMLQREFERDYSFLSYVIRVCEETSLACSQRFLDVFNDTALVQFPPENLNRLGDCTWTETSEPLYQHCKDLEIILREKHC